jgi:hypothetical protein
MPRAALPSRFTSSYSGSPAPAPVYGVKLPAITGNPDFERVYGIQTNTQKWAPIFLPSLWLFAIYIGYVAAAAGGAVWVIGRIVYFLGYREMVPKRTPGLRHPGAGLAPCCGSARSAAPCSGSCIEGAIAAPHTPLSFRA